MRAREYRIGNYVTVRGVIQFIIGIDSNNDWNVEDGLGVFETIRTNVNPMNMSKDGLLYVSEAEPIPLTEDALLGFGFEVKSASVTHNYSYNIGFFVLTNGLRNNISYDGYGIVYVHQLQNLFYSLTNTELTLKDK